MHMACMAPAVRLVPGHALFDCLLQPPVLCVQLAALEAEASEVVREVAAVDALVTDVVAATTGPSPASVGHPAQVNTGGGAVHAGALQKG